MADAHFAFGGQQVDQSQPCLDGNVSLLRSLAVSPDWRRGGLGKALTKRLLDEARSSGISEVVLLKTTAADFFARHFGFVEAERGQFDESLAGSPEWGLRRCSSAVRMQLPSHRFSIDP